jgi:hypothetical protein
MSVTDGRPVPCQACRLSARNENKMNSPRDIVWNAITESAKSRFDYSAFAGSANDTISENILFIILEGHAAGDSVEAIAKRINGQLLLIGYNIPDAELLKYISDRKADCFREIKATETSMALFKMGLKTPGVLLQVRSVLCTP